MGKGEFAPLHDGSAKRFHFLIQLDWRSDPAQCYIYSEVMGIIPGIGFDIVSHDDSANVGKFLPKGLQYKRIGRLRKCNETVKGFNGIPAADSMAAVHAVLFGHHGPDVMFIEGIDCFNQIRAAANCNRKGKHPFLQYKRLGGFGTVKDLRKR